MNKKITAIFILLLSYTFLTQLYSKKTYEITSIGESKKRLIEEALTGLPENRIAALKKCGIGRYNFCFYSLINAIQDLDPKIRKEAAIGFGFLSLIQAIPYIEKAIQIEKLDNVKEEMIWALGVIGEKKSAIFLEKFLPDKNVYIRRITAFSLAMIANKDSLPKLKESITKEDEKIKKQIKIIEDLVVEKRKREIENFLKYFKIFSQKLSDQKQLLSNMYRVKLELIAGILNINADDTKYRIKIISLLENEDSWLRYYTAKVIQKYHIHEARTMLQKIINIEPENKVRTELWKALEDTKYNN